MSKHEITNVMKNIMRNVIGNVIKNILYSISVPCSVFCMYVIINEYTNNKYIAKNTQPITINDTNKIVKQVILFILNLILQLLVDFLAQD